MLLNVAICESEEWAARVLLILSSDIQGLTQQIVEKRFREVSRFVHPDKHGNSDKAKHAQALCTQAKEILVKGLGEAALVDVESPPHSRREDADLAAAFEASLLEQAREAALESLEWSQMQEAMELNKEKFEEHSNDVLQIVFCAKRLLLNLNVRLCSLRLMAHMDLNGWGRVLIVLYSF